MIRDLEKELGLDDALAVESSRIRIRVDNRRYGKAVTLIDGFDAAVDLTALAKDLKQGIGTGGTVKEGVIELQGDQRNKARDRLAKQGYTIEP